MHGKPGWISLAGEPEDILEKVAFGIQRPAAKSVNLLKPISKRASAHSRRSSGNPPPWMAASSAWSFAVIQGGGLPELRRECAEALLEIGFDGYGFGGWPLDSKGNLLEDILGLTRELIPAGFPMHALGVGHPQNILNAYRQGYQIFDSAMPTRDARHARVYAFNQQKGFTGDWMRYVYLNDEKHIKANRPIDEFCDCPICGKYSLGFLHHLFKTGDTLFYRLATRHNLRFMSLLVQRLRESQI